MAQSDKPFNDLHRVRVGIGMSIAELKAGSTYPFATAPSLTMGSDFQAFQITRAYNLVFVDAAGELSLNNVGSEHEFTNITLKNGRVSDMTVMLSGRTNLNQAMTQARALHRWFSEHGYGKQRRPNFVISRRNSKHAIAPITSFEEAEAAFRDPKIKISEMSVFGLQKGEHNVGVSLSNGRRMLAQQAKEYDDESMAAEERTYGLDLFLSEMLKP